MHPSADSNPWIALLTLTAMEILLGVDNVGLANDLAQT